MTRILVLALLIAGAGQTAPAYDDDDDDGFFGVFYSELDPYGEWILVDHDLYAWRPLGIARGWRPYTVGRWMWTRYGWTWMSAEPWGWATYHYGRWYHDGFYGWVWLPGREWAPAWVEWRTGGDIIGWAPLPPYAHFSITLGISFSTRWVTPGDWWTFVDCRHMGAPSMHRYVYRPRYNERYLGRTRAAGSVRYHEGLVRSGGPERFDVERRGRVRVPETDIIGGREVRERASGVGRVRPEERGGREAVRPGRIGEGRLRLDTEAVRPGRSPAPERDLDSDRRSSRRPGGVRDEERSMDRGTTEHRVRRPDERAVPDGRVERTPRRVEQSGRTGRPDGRVERAPGGGQRSDAKERAPRERDGGRRER